MGRGSGFGKTILFGEHFIIYGTPGIVSALDRQADAVVTRTDSGGVEIVDRRSGARGYTESKTQQQLQSLERVFPYLGLESPSVRIEISGTLPAFSGIGASGASSVAIVRGLSEEFGLDLPDEEVNRAAHEAEKAYHGEKTAGIDNLASTYGGLLYCTFSEKGALLTVERLKLDSPVECVLADTGVVADTKEMIEGVASRKQREPGRYAALIAEAGDVIAGARQPLLTGDIGEVGRRLDENHRLLRAIGTASDEQEVLAKLARKHGAVGAKETGAGGGGCVLAMTPGKELQERVAAGVEAEGYAVLRISIGT